MTPKGTGITFLRVSMIQISSCFLTTVPLKSRETARRPKVDAVVAEHGFELRRRPLPILCPSHAMCLFPVRTYLPSAHTHNNYCTRVALRVMDKGVSH